MSSSDDNWDAQTLAIISDITKLISERNNVDLRIVKYDKLNDFIRDVKSGIIQTFVGLSYKTEAELVPSMNFKPLFTHTIYGQKMNRFCLWKKKGKFGSSISGLKGRKIIIDGKDFFQYMTLREMLGEAPENSATITFGPNGSSIIYALALDQADAAVLSETQVNFFKFTNPGPVKDLEKVACGKDVYNPVIYASPKLSPVIITVISDFLKNARNDDGFKKWRPLMKTAKFVFYEPDKAILFSTFNDINAAKKKGWAKSFEKLVSFAE